jgi:hypothetical protein
MERFTQPEADRHLADWLSDIAGDRGQSEAAGAAEPSKSTARRPEDWKNFGNQARHRQR